MQLRPSRVRRRGSRQDLGEVVQGPDPRCFGSHGAEVGLDFTCNGNPLLKAFKQGNDVT